MAKNFSCFQMSSYNNKNNQADMLCLHDYKSLLLIYGNTAMRGLTDIYTQSQGCAASEESSDLSVKHRVRLSFM